MIDIDKLEAMAKAATPGPWHSPGLGEVHDDHSDKVILDVCWQEVGVPFEDSFSGGRQDDAHFVAAANPAAILALIAELRALREALSNPVAWRCDWDGKDGTGVWHQYHDAEDPLPEVWDDEVPTITPLYAAKDKP